MLDKIRRKVDNTTKIEGDKPITMKELKEATKMLLKNKSPGIDSIPAKFYQTFEYVTEWLFEILHHRMKTNTSKEEIFSLIDEKNLGKEKRVPA